MGEPADVPYNTTAEQPPATLIPHASLEADPYQAPLTALTQSQAHLSEVIPSAAIVLYAPDEYGTFTLSEGKGLEAIGLEPGQLVGQSVFEVYKDVPLILRDAKRALVGERVVSVTEVAGIIFESRYLPYFDTEDRVERVVGGSLDITEQKLGTRGAATRSRRAGAACPGSYRHPYVQHVSCSIVERS